MQKNRSTVIPVVLLASLAMLMRKTVIGFGLTVGLIVLMVEAGLNGQASYRPEPQWLVAALSRDGREMTQFHEPNIFHSRASNHALLAQPRQAPPDSRLSSYNVACENRNDCPPFVAQLVVKNSDGGLESCTGFLISDDVLMTNSHCIPDDLKAPESNCTNRIVFTFPATGRYPAEIAQCASVRKTTTLTSRASIDYAVVRLARRVSRPLIRGSQDGVIDGEVLRIAKVDSPLSGSVTGTLRIVRCQAIQNTEFLRNFTNPWAEQIYLDDCPIIGGNSGSPILREDGAVVALVQSGILASRGQELSPPLRAAYETMRGVGFASNFSCIPEISPSGVQTKCQQGRPDLSQEISDEEMARLRVHQDWLIYSQLVMASNVLGWRVADLPNNTTPDTDGRILHRAATPSCVQPAHFWVKNGGFDFGEKAAILVSAEASGGRVTMRFNNWVWAFGGPVLNERLRMSYRQAVFVYQGFDVSLNVTPAGWDGSPVTINGRTYALRECAAERQPSALQALVQDIRQRRVFYEPRPTTGDISNLPPAAPPPASGGFTDPPVNTAARDARRAEGVKQILDALSALASTFGTGQDISRLQRSIAQGGTLSDNEINSLIDIVQRTLRAEPALQAALQPMLDQLKSSSPGSSTTTGRAGLAQPSNAEPESCSGFSARTSLPRQQSEVSSGGRHLWLRLPAAGGQFTVFVDSPPICNWTAALPNVESASGQIFATFALPPAGSGQFPIMVQPNGGNDAREILIGFNGAFTIQLLQCGRLYDTPVSAPGDKFNGCTVGSR